MMMNAIEREAACTFVNCSLLVYFAFLSLVCRSQFLLFTAGNRLRFIFIGGEAKAEKYALTL